MLGGLLIAVCLAVAALSAPATAASNNSTAPTLADGERYNATGMVVTVADDDDVDENSIDADDFALSHGDVAKINVSEAGSNASVLILLTDRLQSDTVEASIADDGDVTDTNGTAMTNGSVTVTGMDTYVPQLRSFGIERINGSAGEIRLTASETLSSIRVDVEGPTTASLNRSDFAVVDPDSYEPTYTATRRFPENGTYRILLVSGTDEAGLSVNFSERVRFTKDPSVPVAVLDGPRHVSAGDTARFSGSRSSDNVGIERYNWSVAGERTGEGAVYEHNFSDPGTYRVSLTVRDSRDNEATANHTVTVHEATSKAGVSVSGDDGSGVQASVAADSDDGPVRVADAYGRLLGRDGVTLRSLVVTLPTNQSVGVNVSHDDAGTGFAEATGASELAAFDVDPGNASLGESTVRFAVSPARLSRAGVSYADVSLYRGHDGWTELDTTVVRATESTVVYEATTPGFSTFVVGGDATRAGSEPVSDGAADSGGEADVGLRSASLAPTTVDYGETAVVTVDLVNEGAGSDTYVTGLTVGSAVVRTRPVTVPAGETRRVELAFEATENATVAVNGTIAGEVAVVGAPTASDPADGTPAASSGNESGSLVGGLPAIPDPLSLWPGGLLGTVLAGVLGVGVTLFAVLKALAIYLGY